LLPDALEACAGPAAVKVAAASAAAAVEKKAILLIMSMSLHGGF
jgi:hypothetical protein